MIHTIIDETVYSRVIEAAAGIGISTRDPAAASNHD